MESEIAMCKTVSILIISDNLTKYNYTADISPLLDGLVNLKYEILKIVFIPCQEKLIIFESNHLMKQSDFVVLISKCDHNVTFASLAKLFNTGLMPVQNINNENGYGEILVPEHSKFLTHKNAVKLQPVVYLSRVFVLLDNNIQVVFDEILQFYLGHLNRSGKYQKKFLFKSDTFNKFKVCNEIFDNVYWEVITEKEVSIIVASSTKFSALTKFETHLMEFADSSSFLNSSLTFSNIYPNGNFQHVNKSLKVSTEFKYVLMCTQDVKTCIFFRLLKIVCQTMVLKMFL